MAALLQFVDQIGASPTVRLDLNTAPWTAAVDGFDFSPPPMVKSYAASILNDGASLNASAYENRVLTLPLDLAGSLTDDQKATQLRLLAVELNRTSNIIRYQPGTTPLFFRTFRSPEFRLAETPVPNYTRVLCSIEAEPFAYGLMQTLSGTVTNDVAAGSNPMSLVFNNILGDVDTPAQIKFTVGAPPPGTTAWLAMRYQSTAPTPLFVQAETVAPLSLGADTTVAGSTDAAMSGSGVGNYTRTTFATVTAMTDRASVIPLGSAGVTLRGTYRAFLRVRKTVAGDVNTARLTFGPLVGSTVTVPATSSVGPFWLDMGLVQVPFGTDPQVDGYSGTAIPVGALTVNIGLGRTSGSGSLDADVVFLVPADVASLAVATRSDSVLDGPTDTCYDLSGGNLTGSVTARAGSIPALRPGSYNQLVFMRGVGATSTTLADSKTATTALTLNYWPLYLTV